MAQEQNILRLRRTDHEGEYLLVQVSASGSKPLDLKLVASENEHVYPAKIKEANVKALQASNYSGDLDEWKTILRYALLRQQPATPLPDALQGLEMVAALGGTTITITLRKNVGGIHQRLGSIKLEQNDAEAIDFFDWAGTAVAAADDLREQLDTLQASVGSQQEQVAKLNRQLDDLVKVKREHEDELLKKCAALLNAKKLKIRDQQRLLAGAKVDPKAAAAVSGFRNGAGSSRKAGDSRKGKRKAHGAGNVEPDEASEDDVAMEEGRLDDDLRHGRETPQQTEVDTTEGEDEDEDGFDAAPPASLAGGRGVGGKGKANETARQQERSGSTAKPVDDTGSPPPRRELPFAQKRANEEVEAKIPEPKAKPVAIPEDEDEETDDEL
ncbi:hypothetical protein B0A55_01145 [Friedmanniomyces simplex]|uniref:Uncharacterized protein n=1 Tax=Friedmanniomyces simplex TaxID=329884 RepID=A0A4U0Y158_9PEZI|nr:hypothetical protein B0A55_01145 [Friedmanniomyces simplex]